VKTTALDCTLVISITALKSVILKTFFPNTGKLMTFTFPWIERVVGHVVLASLHFVTEEMAIKLLMRPMKGILTVEQSV
jgi:hypothetical protein